MLAGRLPLCIVLAVRAKAPGRKVVAYMTGTCTSECAKNVESAFRVFVEHNDFILAVIRAKLGGEADVEDVYQDLFVSFIHKPIPDAVRNVRGYIYKAIAMKTAHAARRAQQYRALLHGYAEQRMFSETDSCAEKTMVDKEEATRALALIESGYLKRSESRAIALRYMDNDKVGDVAKRMDVEARSVSRYISTGLKRMRSLFKVR